MSFVSLLCSVRVFSSLNCDFLAVGRGQNEGFDRLGTPTLLPPVRRL